MLITIYGECSVYILPVTEFNDLASSTYHTVSRTNDYKNYPNDVLLRFHSQALPDFTRGKNVNKTHLYLTLRLM